MTQAVNSLATERKTKVSSSQVTRVYLTPTPPMEPFNDAPSDLLVANRPLADWQSAAFEAAGVVVVDEPTLPCLEVPDNLFITGHLLLSLIHI